LVPIHDVYGPTAYDVEISAMVISEETRAGAQSVNQLRREKDMCQLDVFVIDVIGEQTGKLDIEQIAGGKMSSTRIREKLAGQEH
jgi:phosphopantetheine adenylyltransferase